MTPAHLSAAYAPRLASLAAPLNRKPITRRLPFPPHLELHTYEWALLRGQWRRFFGDTK